jgi:peptidoglycan/xylan/chitin deacetylase (PgdA/CDA1 family)
MNLSQFLWRDGKRIALTTDWDDGTEYDRRLVAILNRYGLKGSFNLCSGKFGMDREQSGWKNFIREDEVAALYQGHEVCSHSVNHKRVWSLPLDQLRWEILEDRCRLETLVGYPVRGFVLPYGWRTGYEWCKDFARSCGFHFLRHSESTPSFDLPSDFLDWKPTCHCGVELAKLWTTMLNRSKDQPGQLFNVWGHSYEFEDDLGWQTIETFAALASETPDVWHATKGEVYDYVMAWRRLDWSLDGVFVRNPSAMPVWFLRNGQIIKIDGGQFLRLDK